MSNQDRELESAIENQYEEINPVVLTQAQEAMNSMNLNLGGSLSATTPSTRSRRRRDSDIRFGRFSAPAPSTPTAAVPPTGESNIAASNQGGQTQSETANQSQVHPPMASPVPRQAVYEQFPGFETLIPNPQAVASLNSANLLNELTVFNPMDVYRSSETSVTGVNGVRTLSVHEQIMLRVCGHYYSALPQYTDSRMVMSFLYYIKSIQAGYTAGTADSSLQIYRVLYLDMDTEGVIPLCGIVAGLAVPVGVNGAPRNTSSFTPEEIDESLRQACADCLDAESVLNFIGYANAHGMEAVRPVPILMRMWPHLDTYLDAFSNHGSENLMNADVHQDIFDADRPTEVVDEDEVTPGQMNAAPEENVTVVPPQPAQLFGGNPYQNDWRVQASEVQRPAEGLLTAVEPGRVQHVRDTSEFRREVQVARELSDKLDMIVSSLAELVPYVNLISERVTAIETRMSAIENHRESQSQMLTENSAVLSNIYAVLNSRDMLIRQNFNQSLMSQQEQTVPTPAQAPVQQQPRPVIPSLIPAVAPVSQSARTLVNAPPRVSSNIGANKSEALRIIGLARSGSISEDNLAALKVALRALGMGSISDSVSLEKLATPGYVLRLHERVNAM